MSANKAPLLATLFALCLGSTALGQSLVKQIETDGTPVSISVNSLNNRVYVAQNNWDESNSTTFLSMIDSNTNSVLKTQFGPGDLVGNSAVDVVTGRLYLVGCRSLYVAEVTCTLNVYDSEMNGLSVISDVAVGSPVAVNPITHRLYYSRQSVDGIAVADTRTNTYLGRIRLGGASPVALDVDPAQNRVYALYGMNRVALVDAHASTVLRTTTVGTENSDVAVDPFRHHVYITNYNRESTARSTVAVLNSDSLALQKKILVGANPSRVAIDTFSGLVFVTNARYRTLYVINEETQLVQQKIDGPWGPVDVNPSTKFAYTGTVTLYIEPITGKVDVIKE